ncbi:hypothetical protein DL96DRAFT_1618576 [Flagelloscypha sp. PMI_526]|nr:hypothetical protein DL96DRAFT_1618576 [Flagelloscypha sp. PMI_526]
MVSGKIYGFATGTRSLPAFAVAALAGFKIEVDPNFKMGETNKSPEYLAKFPPGKIPALELDNGVTIFESWAIARYLASIAPNLNLLGSTPEEAAQVDQWAHLSDLEIGAPQDLLDGILKSGRIPYHKPTHTYLVDKQLNSHLASHTFFVGERITLADLLIAKDVQKAVAVAADKSVRAKIPNVIRHLETIVNSPKLKGIYPATNYVEKALQFVPPKKEEKPKAPKAEQPKAEKKPKAKEEDDEPEPDVPPEVKVKNPLDDLPKSSLNLEDWKRAYSNKETRGPGGAIEWFYANNDAEGYSVWRVDFKYNDELTQTFMSSNQITGFFNRLEASRKYLFGSVGVLGTANNSVISGVFIARGQDIVPVVNVAPDYESYGYKKLDLSSEEDKRFFEAALAWDLEVDGKTWADGKNRGWS